LSPLDQALAHQARDEHRQAVEALQGLLPALPREEDRATALLAMTRSLPRLGRLPEAVRTGSEALHLFELLGDAPGLADTRTAMALVYAHMELGRESMEQALEALDLARQLDDKRREAWALLRVGNAYFALGDPVQARETTQQAREIAQTKGWVDLEFACLNNQAYFTVEEGEQLAREGDVDRLPLVQAMAQTLAQDAVMLAQRERQPYWQALALSNLVEALLQGGDCGRAEPLLLAEMELAERGGYATIALEARFQNAQLAAARGQLDEALALADGLLHDRHPAKAQRLERRTLNLLYQACKMRGQSDAALHHLERLLDAERRAMRQGQALQTQALLIRQEVQSAMARAAHAQADALAAHERAQRLEQEQQRLQERLVRTERAALEDWLTRLANRRRAEDALPLLLQRTHSEPMALALLDIDHFKRVNDRFGHGVGDRVLREFADLLRQQVRGADLLARWGGEEFVLVLVGPGARQAMNILERLRLAVENHAWGSLAEGLTLTTSIGFTLQPLGLHPPAWPVVMQRADQALYRAKAGGRNQVASA
jgi:diguanylate cyclase (GGDEF)-like protein